MTMTNHDQNKSDIRKTLGVSIGFHNIYCFQISQTQTVSFMLILWQPQWSHLDWATICMWSHLKAALSPEYLWPCQCHFLECLGFLSCLPVPMHWCRLDHIWLDIGHWRVRLRFLALTSCCIISSSSFSTLPQLASPPRCSNLGHAWAKVLPN